MPRSTQPPAPHSITLSHSPLFRMTSAADEGKLWGSAPPVSVNFPPSQSSPRPRLQLPRWPRDCLPLLLRVRLHQQANSLLTWLVPSPRVSSSTRRRIIVISSTNVPTGLWPWRPVGTGCCLTRVKGWLGPLTTTAATTGRQTAATDQPTRLPSRPRAVSTSLEYSPVARAALLLTPNVLMASLKRLKNHIIHNISNTYILQVYCQLGLAYDHRM